MSLCNPLHPYISMQILTTILYIFPMVRTRRICWIIKSSFKLTIISNILVSLMFNKVGRNYMLVTQSSNASSKAGFAGRYFSTWLSSLLLQSILMVLICCSNKLRYMFSSCIFSFNWLMAVNKRHCSEWLIGRMISECSIICLP